MGTRRHGQGALLAALLPLASPATQTTNGAKPGDGGREEPVPACPPQPRGGLLLFSRRRRDPRRPLTKLLKALHEAPGRGCPPGKCLSQLFPQRKHNTHRQTRELPGTSPFPAGRSRAGGRVLRCGGPSTPGPPRSGTLPRASGSGMPPPGGLWVQPRTEPEPGPTWTHCRGDPPHTAPPRDLALGPLRLHTWGWAPGQAPCVLVAAAGGTSTGEVGPTPVCQCHTSSAVPPPAGDPRSSRAVGWGAPQY